MGNLTKPLSSEEMEMINENFGLQLQYNDAEHYRAAQVIWTFWKSQEKEPNNTPGTGAGDPEEM